VSYNSVKLVSLKTTKVSCHKIIQDGEISCLETFPFYSKHVPHLCTVRKLQQSDVNESKLVKEQILQLTKKPSQHGHIKRTQAN